MALGFFLLLDNLDIFPIFHWHRWWDFFSWRFVLPVLMIFAGLWMLAGRFRRDSGTNQTFPEGGSSGSHRSLRRSFADRKFLGVCGGIAAYFEIDSTIVRILYVLLVFGSFGFGLLLYFILAFAMPEDRPSHAQS